MPDATHANLRFWFTPDSFEQDNVADDTPVETWRNVAQVGWDRSPVLLTGASVVGACEPAPVAVAADECM